MTPGASCPAQFNGELLEVHQVWDVVRNRAVRNKGISATMGLVLVGFGLGDGTIAK